MSSIEISLSAAERLEVADQLVRYSRALYERGFVAGTDGNLSARVGPDEILATPTCLCKGSMQLDDLVIISVDGRQRAGDRRVSSEIGMHLLIYRLRPDVNAVVHGHPPTATGFAAAGVALDAPILAEAVAVLGRVPLAPYGTPGTPGLAASLEPLIPQHVAILMANHGVVTYAADLRHAYMQMETVEQYARVTLVARQLGAMKPLPEEEVERLRVAGAEYLKGGQ